MKYIVLFVFILCSVNAVELEVGKDGQITKIGDIEISVSKVGVLNYEKISPAALSVDEIKAFEKYFARKERAKHDFRVIGKKVVGDYILFVFDEDHVADGGIDLVYSINAKEVLGWYMGGIRG